MDERARAGPDVCTSACKEPPCQRCPLACPVATNCSCLPLTANVHTVSLIQHLCPPPTAPHLEVSDHVDVLQAGQRGHFAHDACVRTGRVCIQRDLLHRVLPPIQPVDGCGEGAGGE